MMLREILAKNIKNHRNKNNISQESFADLVGLHRTYIGAVERSERNISIDNIEKIAKAMKISASDLLKEEFNDSETK
ncbi:helix-turn-helix domain-containing protein [Providencia sp. PROV099]|uniref:helix-turn-helix domain-containing protein n=1 Tax=Providencia sp. PROV099 TaxID=2949815 RepID=UPI00234987C4|nr:helix-turn-helix transcriptional regulator [Providencia sp. PROV099]WOB97713.1 helix-turn-helix transcriptional regulator [Providencia sp. PROV099]